MGRPPWEVPEAVPDRRAAAGRRWPLAAVPASANAALLAGRTRLAALAPRQGGRCGRPRGHQLGSRAGRCRPTARDLARAHRVLEHRLPWVGDVALRADGCRIRSGHAPPALAACRHAVLLLLRRLGSPIVEGIEHFRGHRRHAVTLARYRRIE